MHYFEPYYDDRYYIIKIVGEFDEKDCRLFVQQMLDFATEIGYRRFGSVNDMREFESITPEAHHILEEGMKLSLKVGFTAVGRVYNDISKFINKELNKANLEAGFIANYFNNIDKAVDFVKKTLEHYDNKPVIEDFEIATYVRREFPDYKITHNDNSNIMPELSSVRREDF